MKPAVANARSVWGDRSAGFTFGNGLLCHLLFGTAAEYLIFRRDFTQDCVAHSDPLALTRDFYDLTKYDDDSSDGTSDLSSITSRSKGLCFLQFMCIR